MKFIGPSVHAEAQCEQVLRSLPLWFGIEEALLEYAQATTQLPTFAAVESEQVVGFVSLRQHFLKSWELHCIAVHADARCKGLGRAMHTHAEQWLAAQGAQLLQVKTLAASHPSPEYAQTRVFYERMGYVPLEVFPELWAPHLPVLQLVKRLRGEG
jgi:GNAT superfamily N-acetyltransferase